MSLLYFLLPMVVLLTISSFSSSYTITRNSHPATNVGLFPSSGRAKNASTRTGPSSSTAMISFPSASSMRRIPTTPFRHPPSTETTTKATALRMIQNTSSFTFWQLVRGGAIGTAAQWLPAVNGVFQKLQGFVGESRMRCILMLVSCIGFESYATILSKRARDAGSVIIFLHACSVYLCCMLGFNLSLAKLDVSVAYALWSAMGTVLVTVAGVVFFGESFDIAKFICLAMIIAGVVGLNLR